jgi:hypothetical protein
MRRFRLGSTTTSGTTDEITRRQLVEIARAASRKAQSHVHRARLGQHSAGTLTTIAAHHGRGAIKEDVRVDAVIKEEVRRRFGARALYYGEEIGTPAAYETFAGQTIIESDAIDGSDPFKNLRYAYSTSITASRVRRNGSLRVEAHVTVTPVGMVSFAVREEVVHVEIPGVFGAPGHHYRLDGSSPLEGSVSAMAVVAARPEHASKITGLLASRHRDAFDVSVYDVGAGNPAIVNLLLDGLGWVYEPSETVSWDLAALMALELAGGAVFSLDGRRREIIREFEALTDFSKDRRLMPGYIAVARPEMLPAVMDVLSDPASAEAAA